MTACRASDRSVAVGPGKGRNRELQWLRAVAATCVVFFHAAFYVGRATGDDRFASVLDGRLGFLGVAIFFALSGYLMAEILPRASAASFLAHRIVRIYPLFLLIVALSLVGRSDRQNLDLLALSLVPIGQGRFYPLGVEWTLLFELTFYVVLYLVSLAGLKRHVSAFAAVWLGVTLVATWFRPGLQSILTPTILELPLMAANAAFAGGLLIPALRDRGAFRPILACVAVLAAFGFSMGGIGANRWIAAVCAVIIVGSCVSYAPTCEARSNAWRILDRYGDWSYALYLCHVKVILVTLKFGQPVLPSPLLFGLCVALPFLVAVPFGIADIAIYRRMRRWVDGAPRAFLAASTTAFAVSFAACAAFAALALPDFCTAPPPAAQTVHPQVSGR